MKRRDLEKRLKKAGFELVRHGSDHDIFKRGKDKEELPRHREIEENLAKHIIKKWGL